MPGSGVPSPLLILSAHKFKSAIWINMNYGWKTDLGYRNMPSGRTSVSCVTRYFVTQIGRIVDVGIVAHHSHVEKTEHVYKINCNQTNRSNLNRSRAFLRGFFPFLPSGWRVVLVSRKAARKSSMNLAEMYMSSGSKGAKSASPFWMSFMHSNLQVSLNSLTNRWQSEILPQLIIIDRSWFSFEFTSWYVTDNAAPKFFLDVDLFLFSVNRWRRLRHPPELQWKW